MTNMIYPLNHQIIQVILLDIKIGDVLFLKMINQNYLNRMLLGYKAKL